MIRKMELISQLFSSLDVLPVPPYFEASLTLLLLMMQQVSMIRRLKQTSHDRETPWQLKSPLSHLQQESQVPIWESHFHSMIDLTLFIKERNEKIYA